MAVNNDKALAAIALVREMIRQAQPGAADEGVHVAWARDMPFLDRLDCALTTQDVEYLRDIIDEMRNLSQGFGGYLGDTSVLDGQLEVIHEHLTNLFSLGLLEQREKQTNEP